MKFINLNTLRKFSVEKKQKRNHRLFSVTYVLYFAKGSVNIPEIRI